MSLSNPYQEPHTGHSTHESQNVELGNMTDVRSVPRITIQCFCETNPIRQTLESAAADRRMSRAHVSVNQGGISGAVEFYSSSPTPNLIIVESQHSGNQLMAELGRLSEVCDPDTKVFVIGHFNDILLYRELIANGISEYLVAPLTMADIMSSISAVFSNPESGKLGRLFVFMGAKGGCGSSTICHNVAWTISSEYQNEVVLGDFDLAFGTANINLNQDPTQGIAEAVFSPERLDDILLDRLLAKCAEHLSLLAAPSTLERTYDFDSSAFTSIIELIQNSAPTLIVDLPNQWNGWTRQVLSAADEVIITAEPELANLRNAKNLVDTINEIRPNDDQCKLVMNKVGMTKRPEISISDFSSALELEPSAVIPFEPALFGSASNNGQMISETDGKSPVIESFQSISRSITGRSEIKNEQNNKLPFLKKLGLKK